MNVDSGGVSSVTACLAAIWPVNYSGRSQELGIVCLFVGASPSVSAQFMQPQLMVSLALCCSIDDSLHVKLADNALARDLFPDDYCCLADNINRSIKWMAMEAILTNQYTPAADVVSRGSESRARRVLLVWSHSESRDTLRKPCHTLTLSCLGTRASLNRV